MQVRALLVLLLRQICGSVGVSWSGNRFLELHRRALSGAQNVTEVSTLDHIEGNFTDCEPPANVSSQAKTRGLSLISKTGSFAVYAAEDDSESELMIFDCVSGKKLVFLHIPKNAGTTIENLGITGGKLWGRFEAHGSQVMPDGNTCMKWHVPPSMLTGPSPYNDPTAEVFCVSRDPWGRMASEYVYLLSVYHKWPMPHVHDVGPACSKAGFNAFVQNSIADMERGMRWMTDCHLLPQWDFVEDKWGRQWCDQVLDIKELTPQFNSLMAKHGLSLRMAPHNKANSASSWCPAVKSMSLHELYAPETQTAMRRMYWKDFQHLGDSLK